jgi:hypothetical protein
MGGREGGGEERDSNTGNSASVLNELESIMRSKLVLDYAHGKYTYGGGGGVGG